MQAIEFIEYLQARQKTTPVAISFNGELVEPKLSDDSQNIIITAGSNAIASRRFGPGRDDETDVHTEHCCYFCGCKYGNNDCTVKRGCLKQSFEHLNTSVCYDMKPGYYDGW